VSDTQTRADTEIRSYESGALAQRCMEQFKDVGLWVYIAEPMQDFAVTLCTPLLLADMTKIGRRQAA